MLSPESVVGIWKFAPYTLMGHEIQRYNATRDAAKEYVASEIGDKAVADAGVNDAYKYLIHAKGSIEQYYNCQIELDITNGNVQIKSIERPDDHAEEN